LLAVLSGAVLAMIGVFAATRIANNTRRAEKELNSTAKVSRTTQSYSSATQKDAEQLLERATRKDGAATSQIETRAASWRGQLRLTPKLTNLITAGLNSNDRQVRAATVQLDLAAMNITEDSSSVDRLAAQAESKNHATRIWALWTLGLLANRGIATDHITEILIAHLSDSDADARRWAAEGLTYTGRDTAIQPLLKAMHDDASPVVREAAARGLAQSGMFTMEQRRSAIPTLLVYTNDPALDGATRAWTFHALRDITEQHLPDDAAKWNEWYANNR
jgi:HEAT repeat protein